MDSCCCVTESKKWFNSDSHCIPHFATLSQLLLPFPGPVKEPGVKISSSFTWDKNQLEAVMSLRPVAWLPSPPDVLTEHPRCPSSVMRVSEAIWAPSECQRSVLKRSYCYLLFKNPLKNHLLYLLPKLRN